MLQGLPGIRNKKLNHGEVSYGMRNGVVIEKGVVMTEAKMLKAMTHIKDKMEFYTAYPDLFVDEVLLPTDSNFKLMFMQRIFLRAVMRISVVHITAARGFSKTFTALLGLILKCIFQPGSEIALAAPKKAQAAEIGTQKMSDILKRFPFLANEIKSQTGGKDYVKVVFRNGSVIEVTAALETTRGRRFSTLMSDELRDQDGDKVNSILLPTLVISRRTAVRNILNPKEPHQAQIFTTSASAKSSYNYEKLIEIFETSVIQPNKAIVFGFDYRVPVMEGLYTNEYIQSMKLSPTFKEEDFAREFLSIYTSDNEDSWFNFKQMNRHRKMINAEWSAKFRKGLNEFYLLSIDVGRYSDQTVCTVFKVRQTGEGKLKAAVVNIYVLGRSPDTKHFEIQSRHIKRLIKIYDAREVVIDTNGLGAAIADYMIMDQWDTDGSKLPAYGFMNDDNYKATQPHDAPRIIYGVKASGQLNSAMFGNCYSRIDSGMVDFLIKEQEARTKLLSTKKGQKMRTEEKAKRLMPYEMTTRLFEEMGNLRLKTTGAQTIALEKINTRFPKDKFSSLTMGLWRIKELEDKSMKIAKKQRRRKSRQLVFYSDGG